MNTFPVDIRAKRDLVTNPAWSDVLVVMDEMVRKTTVSLTLDAQGTDISKVNKTAGMLEGMKLVQKMFGNYREEALKDFHGEPDDV